MAQDNAISTEQAPVLLALTIRQPWAGLIMSGRDIENRSWRTHYRGRLAVHAAARVDRAGVERFPGPWPTGVVLGTVELIDCIKGAESEWALEGHWHWIVGDARPLKNPIPMTGRLGLWSCSI